jgi:hypothetical protein
VFDSAEGLAELSSRRLNFGPIKFLPVEVTTKVGSAKPVQYREVALLNVLD